MRKVGFRSGWVMSRFSGYIDYRNRYWMYSHIYTWISFIYMIIHIYTYKQLETYGYQRVSNTRGRTTTTLNRGANRSRREDPSSSVSMVSSSYAGFVQIVYLKQIYTYHMISFTTGIHTHIHIHIYIYIWNITMCNGKTHYFDGHFQ